MAGVLFAGGSVFGADDEKVDFDRDVKGILSDNCFKCHGPDDKDRKEELRLDLREQLFAKRGDHFTVVPGKPGESELFKRIVSDDEFAKMPPPDSGKTLTKKQIDIIRKWIAQGAEWKGHWAYTSVKRPAVVNVKRPGFVRNEIDRFVLGSLNRKRVAPANEADRITLIRRLSFDLTGLPPTTAQVTDFLADKSDGAYEALVDRLLRSPHFGERMALYWLDQVRYADTGGYHSDNHRDVWLYRDYVIKSFNENLPSINSPSNNWQVICCPNQHDGNGSPRVTTGCSKRLRKVARRGKNIRQNTTLTVCGTFRKSGWPRPWDARNAITTSSTRSQ